MTKTIIITGASRGIGAATALLAAKKDYIFPYFNKFPTAIPRKVATA